MNVRTSIAGLVLALSFAPVDIGYGLIVFGAIDASRAALGVASGWVAVLLSTAFLAWRLRTGHLFTSIRPTQALTLVALFGHAFSFPSTALIADHVVFGLSLVVCCTVMSGLIQMLMGYAHLGRLVSFVPRPVLSGVVSAASLGLAFNAIQILFRLFSQNHVSLVNLAFDALLKLCLQGMFYLVLIVSLLYLMHWASRRLVVFNWSLLGLLAGTALFWLCTFFGDWAGFLGTTLPVLSLIEQLPVFFKTHVFLFESGILWHCIWLSLPYAFVIAIINSLEALVANARFERATEISHNPVHLLVSLGQANIFSGLLGGLPVSLSNTKMILAYSSGVRDLLGVWAHCGALLLMILTTAWYVHWIPYFALAAVMLYLAWAMLDAWSFVQIRTWLRWSEIVARFSKPHSTPWIFMLVLIVASLSNLVWGVLVGLLCTIFVFVQRQSKSVVRRFGCLSECRSVVMRNPAQAHCLSQVDDRVAYVELQGALFFGTAESLLKFIRANLTAQQQVLIIDARKLLEVDDAGCEAIERLQVDLTRRGGMLVLSAWDDKALESSADDLLTLKQAMNQPIFASYDAAAEFCEDWLLQKYGDESTLHDVCEFDANGGHLYFLQQLKPEHRKVLLPLLQPCYFVPGQIIFARGEDCDGMYLVMSGRVDIWLNHGQIGAIRLASCRQGVSFGEMAFVSARPRSADAVAVGHVSAMRLSQLVLKTLEQEAPLALADLMGVIARDLSGRLYQSNANLRLALQ